MLAQRFAARGRNLSHGREQRFLRLFPDEPDLLGLYDGYALTERGWDYAGSLPDRIMIYREAICEICETEDDVVDEVTITVVHEIAHHFGIEEERLHELGWG